MVRWVAALAMLVLAGCAENPSRPVVSSYGCMRAVRDALPGGLPAVRAHCLAAGVIARRCSVAEGYIAGVGKELQDLLGDGDASWEDWGADRAGLGCARALEKEEELARCCEGAGY